MLVLGWALTAALLGPAAVPADDFALKWEAPAECPSRATLRERIASLVGGEREQRRGLGLQVLGRAKKVDDGTWTVEIELSTPEGTWHRTVPHGRDCAEAAEAAAVIVAIAIDPRAAERIETSEDLQPVVPDAPDSPGEPTIAGPEPSPTPPGTEPTEPGQPAESEPPPDRPPEPATPVSPEEPTPTPAGTPRPRDRMRGMAAVLGGLGYGALPGVTGAVGGELGLLWPRLRVTASGSWWFRRRETAGSATIDFQQWTVAVRTCPVFGVRPRIEVMICAGLEGGQTLVRSEGLAQATNPDDPWVAWLLQPALAVPATRWLALRAGVEAFGPLMRRNAYHVRGFGEVFRPTAVGVRGVVAIEARFP